MRRLLKWGGPALVLGAAVGLLVPRAGSAPPEGYRIIASEVAPDGIDTGVVRAGRGPGLNAAGEREVPVSGAVPGKIIVKFRDGASGAPGVSGASSASARTAVARALGARTITRPTYADFDLVEIDPAMDPEAAAASLAGRDEVEYAQAVYRYHAYARPNDPLYSLQWNLIQLQMDKAWDINPGATRDVVVAVIDTGVAFRSAIVEYDTIPYRNESGTLYPSLGRVTVPYAAAPELGAADRFVAPRDFIWDDDAPFDTDGHGTHVSGTIGQLTNNGVGVAGMAYNVRIMPVKAITSDWDDVFNSPFVGTDDIVARAIRYAADNGAKVINMSLGRTEGGAATAVGDAMRYAVSRGVFVAVAAGNDYERGNPIERLAEQAGPIDGAMVVAATGNDSTRAYYSGVRDYVEIAAPGGNARQPAWIYQQTYDPDFTEYFLGPLSGYRAPRFDVFATMGYQGTSMATPHVAGFAALLYSQGIANPAAIEAAMKKWAIDRGAAGRDDQYGFGSINPRTTLRGLGIAR